MAVKNVLYCLICLLVFQAHETLANEGNDRVGTLTAKVQEVNHRHKSSVYLKLKSSRIMNFSHATNGNVEVEILRSNLNSSGGTTRLSSDYVDLDPGCRFLFHIYYTLEGDDESIHLGIFRAAANAGFSTFLPLGLCDGIVCSEDPAIQSKIELRRDERNKKIIERMIQSAFEEISRKQSEIERDAEKLLSDGDEEKAFEEWQLLERQTETMASSVNPSLARERALYSGPWNGRPDRLTANSVSEHWRELSEAEARRVFGEKLVQSGAAFGAYAGSWLILEATVDQYGSDLQKQTEWLRSIKGREAEIESALQDRYTKAWQRFIPGYAPTSLGLRRNNVNNSDFSGHESATNELLFLLEREAENVEFIKTQILNGYAFAEGAKAGIRFSLGDVIDAAELLSGREFGLPEGRLLTQDERFLAGLGILAFDRRVWKKLFASFGSNADEAALTALGDAENFIASVERHGMTEKQLQHFMLTYAKAPAAKIEIDELANNIASAFNGSVATSSIKLSDRAIQKIMHDYGGKAEKIADLARNTIVVEQHQVPHVTRRLKEAGAKILEIDPSLDPLGYSGTNAKVLTRSGIYGEIQVNSPQMIFAKEPEATARLIIGDHVYDRIESNVGVKGGLGHAIYESWRTSQNDAHRKLLEKQSKDYYEVIRGFSGGS